MGRIEVAAVAVEWAHPLKTPLTEVTRPFVDNLNGNFGDSLAWRWCHAIDD